MSHLASYPPDLPVPVDDGACAHLEGADFPSVALPSTGPFGSSDEEETEGSAVDVAQLSQSGLVIVFFYPRTAPPEETVPPEWNAIPGARGCTPQNC